MLIELSNFHFFHNRQVDALYVTLSLVSFAEALISVFVPVYLWKLGFPIWEILLFYFLLSFYFVILSFSLLPLFRRISDKLMIFLSIPSLVLFYLGLELLGDVSIFFFLLPLLWAVKMLFFNVGYHLSFTAAYDDEEVGREVGMRSLLRDLSQFAAPVLGGFLITAFGFKLTFVLGSAILLLSVVPLLFFPRRRLSSSLNTENLKKYIFDKDVLNYSISGSGYAVEQIVLGVIWALFVFFALGDVESLGAIVSIGLLVGALLTYLVGFLSDQGKRRRLLLGTALGNALLWFVRPLLLFFPAGWVSVSHIAGKSFNSTMLVAWTSQFYKIARKVDHTSVFILSREVIYRVSRMVILIPLMLIAYHFSALTFFVLSFIIAGVASLFMLFANRQKPTRALDL